jgi:hypothetical protein
VKSLSVNGDRMTKREKSLNAEKKNENMRKNNEKKEEK